MSSSSIDSDYLKVRVKEAIEAVKELERLTSKPFNELSFDERHSMRYQIIVLAEAIGSICIHISMEDLGYEPESYSDCIAYLSKIYYSRIEGRRKREILEKLKCVFEEDNRIVLAYIFGSFTRRNLCMAFPSL